MSMRSVLGVIGGIVGAYFGYPQLGFIAGSLIGAALEPGKNTQGPRLDDLKVTVSTYGGGIPTVYGTMRIGGNAIWSTDKTEIGTTTTQGKGGAPTNTSYRYFVSMMLGLCRTPAPGTPIAVRKAWQDGKLMGDTSAGIPVGSVLATAENPFANIAILPGFEDELPVSQIEQVEGIGNVPAYRGLSKMFVFGLETPGGRIPQISVELCMSPGVTQTKDDYSDVPAKIAGDQAVYAVIRKNGVWHINTTGTWDQPGFTFNVYNVGPGYANRSLSIAMPVASNSAAPIPLSGDGDPCVIYPHDGSLTLANLNTGEASTIFIYDTSVTRGWHGYSLNRSAGFDSLTGKYVLHAGDGDYPNTLFIFDGKKLTIGDDIPGAHGAVTIQSDIAYALSQVSGALVISRFNGSTGALLDSSTSGPTYADSIGSIKVSGLHPGVDGLYAWVLDRGISGGGHDYKLYLIDFSSGSAAWTLLNGNAGTYVGEKLAAIPTTIYADKQILIIGPSTETGMVHNYALDRNSALSPTSANVADIISDQCKRAGLTADQIDVSTITDTVWGYTITNPASARTNIQPLMTAFAIDATEEDGKIKFFKRANQVSVATIAYDELACAEDGAAPGDPMPLTRGQEAELPRSVAVSYPNPAFDYQTCTEKAIRQVTTSQLDQVVELPIAMTGDQAASIAQTILYDAWNERDKRSFSVLRKYQWLNAGDVATIENPRGTFKQYRITKFTDTGATIQGECVNFDAGVYTQTVIGSSGGTGQVVSPLAVPQRLELGDMPILQDADNNAGLYAFMEPYGGEPTGAELFVGDDDTNLTSRGTVENGAVIGFAEGALGNFLQGGRDEKNTLIVNVGGDDLSSTTRDLLYTSTINAAAIGVNGRWEIIQFLRASSLGSGRFLLSGFLRGRRGTERNRGTHLAGDTFILLSKAGTLRPNMDAGQIGQTKSYRAISKGRSLDSTSSKTYANTAEGLKPFSPWDVRKTKAASNDQTLTWRRRTRLSSNSLRGIVPLGESSEAYRVDFYTSNSFATWAGTLASTSRSLTITSAQQTAFGLTPGASLFVHISQVSDIVGAGAPLEATV